MLTIDLDSVKGVVVAVVRGSLTLDMMREYALTAWGAIEGPRIHILWDLRDARFNLSTSEVVDLADFIKQHTPAGDVRIAFVVAGELEFGLVRMFEVYRAAEGARTAVFRDKKEALEWLAGASDREPA